MNKRNPRARRRPFSPKSRSRFSFSLLAGVILCASQTGCKTCGYVEAELRYQTARLDELKAELLMKDAEIQTLRATVNSLRATNAPPAAATETLYRVTGVSRITLGPATGGKDLNNDGVDDAVLVTVAPRDADNDVFKCPGTIRVDAFEKTSDAESLSVGSWELSPDEVRERWNSSLMGAGYKLTLPWSRAPLGRQLEVEAAFTTLDGRQFRTRKQISVRTNADRSAYVPFDAVDVVDQSNIPLSVVDPSDEEVIVLEEHAPRRGIFKRVPPPFGRKRSKSAYHGTNEKLDSLPPAELLSPQPVHPGY